LAEIHPNAPQQSFLLVGGICRDVADSYGRLGVLFLVGITDFPATGALWAIQSIKDWLVGFGPALAQTLREIVSLDTPDEAFAAEFVTGKVMEFVFQPLEIAIQRRQIMNSQKTQCHRIAQATTVLCRDSAEAAFVAEWLIENWICSGRANRLSTKLSNRKSDLQIVSVADSQTDPISADEFLRSITGRESGMALREESSGGVGTAPDGSGRFKRVIRSVSPRGMLNRCWLRPRKLSNPFASLSVIHNLLLLLIVSLIISMLLGVYIWMQQRSVVG
jgi:hypothetical protein